MDIFKSRLDRAKIRISEVKDIHKKKKNRINYRSPKLEKIYRG